MTDKEVLKQLKEYQNWVMKTHFPRMTLEDQAMASIEMLDEEEYLKRKLKSKKLRNNPIKRSYHARTRN